MANTSSKITNTLTTDQYGFLEAFQEFTSNYFAIEPDNSKLGLFGYINEIAAHMGKSGAFHRNMLYGEFCLNTAMMPSTVYNMAVDESIEPDLAVSSKSTVILDIPGSQLEDAIANSKQGFITFDREKFVVTMDTVEFRLPYSLVIRQDDIGIRAFYKSVAFTDSDGVLQPAEYQISKKFDIYGSSPFVAIKSYVNNENKKMFSFKIDVFNYALNLTEEIIYSNRLDGKLLFPVSYSDSLMGFKVLYKQSPSANFELISTLQSKSIPLGESKFCFYKFVDDSNYQVFFSNTNDVFRLAVNSTVLIKTYTTEGSEANFEYSGIPTVQDEDHPFEFLCSIFTHPVGGLNRPDLMTLKKEVFKAKTKVEYKGSANDLALYFTNEYGTKVQCVKSRDDLLMREYTAFFMIPDENGNPFPTNTAKVWIPGNCSFVDSSMPIYYDPDDGKFKLYTLDSDIENLPSALQAMITDETKFVYFSPYSIDIGVFSNIVVSNFYDEHIDDTYIMNYDILSSGTTDVPSVNYLSAYRNPIYAENLTMKLSVTTETPNKYRFIMVVLDNTSNPLYWIEFLYSPDDSSYIAEFIPHVLTEESARRFENGSMIFDNSDISPVFNTTGEMPESFILGSSCKFLLYTLEEISIKDNLSDNKSTFDSYFSNLASIDTFNNYRIKARLSCTDEFKFFSSVGDIVRSETEAVSEEFTTLDYLPLVGYNVLFNDRRYEYFFRELKKKNEEFAGVIDQLANSTSINTKLYNTYGPSDNFFLKLKESSNADTTIGRTNLKITLEIDREDGYSPEVDAQIREICKDYVNNIDNLLSNNQVLNSSVSLSNLSTSIEQKIPSLISCNVLAINDEPYPRKITYNLSTIGPVLRVPEMLALDLRRKPSDLTSTEELNIEIIYIS